MDSLEEFQELSLEKTQEKFREEFLIISVIFPNGITRTVNSNPLTPKIPHYWKPQEDVRVEEIHGYRKECLEEPLEGIAGEVLRKISGEFLKRIPERTPGSNPRISRSEKKHEGILEGIESFRNHRRKTSGK